MPEEESEDETDSKTHKPGDKHEGGAFDVGKMAQNWHPFWNLAGRLCKHFTLPNKNN